MTKLKLFLERNDITPPELAKLADLARGVAYLIANGTMNPTAEQGEKIAAVLSTATATTVTVDDFWKIETPKLLFARFVEEPIGSPKSE